MNKVKRLNKMIENLQPELQTINYLIVEIRMIGQKANKQYTEQLEKK